VRLLVLPIASCESCPTLSFRRPGHGVDWSSG
jgi:hypothetical protein